MGKPSQMSAEERLSVVLESLRPEASIADLCRKHGISQTTFYKWRDKFLEGGKQALLSNGQAKGSEDRKSTRLNSSHSQISYAPFFFNDTATTEIYTLSLHDALPI